MVSKKWLTDTPSYKNMKKDMHFGNDKWNAVIPDQVTGGSSGTKTDLLLLNKSLMVYKYSMHAALSSPHGKNVQIIREQFMKTVNAFIHDEKNMASRDLISYYDKAIKLRPWGEFLELNREGLIKLPKFELVTLGRMGRNPNPRGLNAY